MQSEATSEEVGAALAVMAERLNGNERLVEKGRLATGRVLFRADEMPWLLYFERGRIADIADRRLVMPSATFALTAPARDWALFWQPVPPPFSHDILALAKRGALRIEGDLHMLFSNILYFKAVLALPRERTGGTA